MRRRDVIVGLASSATAWPRAGRAERALPLIESAWVDGLANAPTGTPQFQNILNNYPAGHGRRDKSVINQPPFNVPGVDYRVGMQTGVTLVTPSAGNMPPGCTWSTHTTSGSGGSGIVVAANSGNVTIQNFDMGNATIEIHTTGLANVLIKNCRWNLTGLYTPIFFFTSNAITTIQYCEMYANGQNLPDGFITWQQGGGSANAITTIEYCYFEKTGGNGFDWRGGAGQFVFQFSVIYDVGMTPNQHPDITQIQSGGPQKMWNNLGYNPDAGTQGFGAWDPIFPSSTCQHVFIGPTSTTAYTINDGSALGFSPTNKFIFHNNHHNAIRGLYPNYITANADVSGNIHMPNGATFS